MGPKKAGETPNLKEKSEFCPVFIDEDFVKNYAKLSPPMLAAFFATSGAIAINAPTPLP
ncbi:hypothetical protein [Leptothermofonsia sp. ETS-13]|uniref:hypothetical protein n=1 Tax=Leptothermofonsia sp. ETS-13 TaxID=3035696 RepID=UPI003BA1F201